VSRRKFIKNTGAAITAAALSASLVNAPAVHAKKRYRWKMVTAWPPNFPIFQEGAERFARDVRQITNGRLNIQVFAGGQLIPPLQTFDAVSRGTVQMGHGAAYYWAGKVPAAQFFTAVPFGMNAQGMNAWLYYGGGLELWREIYKKFNLIPFPMGNTGVQMGGWFNTRINSVRDLKGLKMRIPGLGGKVMAKAGVNPVLIAGGEIYTAMERGTIDAVEWAGPFHDLRLGLYRTAKHYYYPGWHEPGPTLELSINRQAWGTLPTDLQLAVSTAAAAQNQSMLSEFEVKNLAALHELQNKYRVQLEQFPDGVIKTLHRLTNTVLQEQAKKDKAFKKVLRAYSSFQKNNNAWNHISEAAYARAKIL
jgi:TRAP-type mannitol/chloroaromatic compound transport system substrate-binding protein